MTRRGEQPRFTKHGKGYVGLAKWNSRSLSLTTQIEQHNQKVRKRLHEHLGKMKPSEFEVLIGRLLTAIGFESVAVTPLSGDGGLAWLAATAAGWLLLGIAAFHLGDTAARRSGSLAHA